MHSPSFHRYAVIAPSLDDGSPTTEPFATCVAAIARHVEHPERALCKALRNMAEQQQTSPETILMVEARRHGYRSVAEFRLDLIPAIEKRRHEIDANDIFCDKDIDYAR